MNQNTQFIGKSTSLYYNPTTTTATYCPYCNIKYAEVDVKHAPCQKIQILQITGEQNFTLAKNVLTVWLVDPFIGFVDPGQVISLTGYFYMTPNQRIDNGRLVSGIAIGGMAFDILKVNPFN